MATHHFHAAKRALVMIHCLGHREHAVMVFAHADEWSLASDPRLPEDPRGPFVIQLDRFARFHESEPAIDVAVYQYLGLEIPA